MSRNFYEKAKSEKEIKKLLHLSAEAYSSVCDKEIMFISRINSPGAKYHYHEIHYGKENFIHLVGCCANENVSAEQFYDKCLETEDIPSQYIKYKESRAAASSKLQVFRTLFDFRHVKIYKIGEHDKINEKNSFQFGLGNAQGGGVMGFTKYAGLPVPTSVLVNPLSEYSSSEENVLAVLSKCSKKYDNVIGSVKSGLKLEELPNAIKDKVSFPEGVIGLSGK